MEHPITLLLKHQDGTRSTATVSGYEWRHLRTGDDFFGARVLGILRKSCPECGTGPHCIVCGRGYR